MTSRDPTTELVVTQIRDADGKNPKGFRPTAQALRVRRATLGIEERMGQLCKSCSAAASLAWSRPCLSRSQKILLHVVFFTKERRPFLRDRDHAECGIECIGAGTLSEFTAVIGCPKVARGLATLG